MPFTLVSWNVNSVRTRLDHVLTYLAEHEPDVVFLQETKVEDELFPRVPFMELGYAVTLHGGKGYAGVATMSKVRPTAIQRGFRDGPPDQHARLLQVDIADTRFINLYAPNGGSLESEAFSYKLAWYARLRSELDAHAQPDQRVILAGDFNIAPDARDVFSVAAMRGQTHFTPQEHEVLAKLVEFGLHDCFRKHDPRPGQFSWYDYRSNAFERREGMRIDLIYATTPAWNHCAEVHYDETPRRWKVPSDHLPLVARFDA